jgi:hypothetical protein
MPPVRRLTAILAADVAGYWRLMGWTRKACTSGSKRIAARSSNAS